MNPMNDPSPVVVGVDGSTSSILALRKAAEFAATLQTELLIVTCWSVPNFYNGITQLDDAAFERDARERQAAALATAFESGCPVHAQKRVCEGRPGTELVKASAQAQLLVLGTRGHGEFVNLLLGSVSLECIAHANCPVLTVRET
ncbi:universal stress protein [Arthrobacter sp. JSM 101049]|uniref:universal stress protein n=1 Tax=Arthrobacter sp. JSM 101049 TaxID=929097 RepID=UPI0035615FB9